MSAQYQFNQEPASLNLEFVGGDDFSLPLEFVDLNLTGYSFEARIARHSNPCNFFMSFTITEVNLAEGLITLSLTETQTAELGATTGNPWYLAMTDGSGFRRTYLSGRVTLNPSTISGYNG